MNATEYVAFLEKSTEQTEEEKLEALEYIRETSATRAVQMGITQDEYLEIVETMLKPQILENASTGAIFRPLLYTPLLHALPESFRVIAEAVPFGVISLRTPNAQTLKAPDGNPVVVLNQGLITAARFHAETLIGTGVLSKKQSFETVYRFLMAAYARIVNYFTVDGLGDLPHTEIEFAPGEFEAVLALAQSIELFVICHELSHVFCGHMQDAETKWITPENTDYRIEIYQRSHQQEVEADFMGWELYQNIRQKIPWAKSQVPTACLEIFVILALVERNTGVPDPYSTHPSSIKRLWLLTKYIESYGNEADAKSAQEVLQRATTVPGQADFLNVFG